MEFNEDVIRLDHIWQVIKKGLAFIIIISLLFAAGSFVATKFFMNKTYTSSVKLYVETKSTTENMYESLQSVNYAEKLVSTYMQMLDTQVYYKALAKELNNKYTPETLGSMITFTAVEDTEIFEADVVASSPAEAKSIAMALTKTAPKRISDINDTAKLKIVDLPVLPKFPTSPNTSKNVFVAFFLGVIVSVVILFIRKGLDKKIKYTQEMTTICDLPVLAAIPDFYLAANAKRKDDYTPSHGQEYDD